MYFSFNHTTMAGQWLKSWDWTVLKSLLRCQNVPKSTEKPFKLITKRSVTICMKWLNCLMSELLEFLVLLISLLMEGGMTKLSLFQWKKTIRQSISLTIGFIINPNKLFWMNNHGLLITLAQGKLSYSPILSASENFVMYEFDLNEFTNLNINLMNFQIILITKSQKRQFKDLSIVSIHHTMCQRFLYCRLFLLTCSSRLNRQDQTSLSSQSLL